MMQGAASYSATSAVSPYQLQGASVMMLLLQLQALRDVKCDNVLLSGPDATVKLADFGWSCADQVSRRRIFGLLYLALSVCCG